MLSDQSNQVVDHTPTFGGGIAALSGSLREQEGTKKKYRGKREGRKCTLAFDTVHDRAMQKQNVLTIFGLKVISGDFGDHVCINLDLGGLEFLNNHSFISYVYTIFAVATLEW